MESRPLELEPKLREACGVVGVASRTESAPELTYLALQALQHRGQDAAGIAISDGERITVTKDTGKVHVVFNNGINLIGWHDTRLASGQVLYGTRGVRSSMDTAQPFLYDGNHGRMTLAHNGHLRNIEEVADRNNVSTIPEMTDSAILTRIVGEQYDRTGDLEEAINTVIPDIKGSFSLVLMDKDRLITVRDAHGIRPLSVGALQDGGWAVASETTALDMMDAEFDHDVASGTYEIITPDRIESKRWAPKQDPKLCAIEHVYFASPDSVIDGSVVEASRIKSGRILAREHPAEADIVIGVPDSGRSAGYGFGHELRIPTEGEAIIKRRGVAIDRTFIEPTQELRQQAVKQKFNVVPGKMDGKRVVLVDDSVVRGNTMRHLVELIRDRGGATEVHLRLASPMLKNICDLGVDLGNPDELIARKKSLLELQEYLNVDSLGFLSTEGLRAAIGGSVGRTACTGCMDGSYAYGSEDIALVSESET